jgi:hypothetical protein
MKEVPWKTFFYKQLKFKNYFTTTNKNNSEHLEESPQKYYLKTCFQGHPKNMRVNFFLFLQ